MPTQELTCWSLIRDAAGGDREARERFARSYATVIKSYLATRWQARPDSPAIEDTVQDVFVECFKPGGVLAKVDADYEGGFRAYLYGVVRNIARKKEMRVRTLEPLPDSLQADDTSAAKAFDRAWARALLREAARLQAQQAQGDRNAEQRVELLRLRFQEGLPIRDIAAKWNVEAAKLHHDYATARTEFKAAIRMAVQFHSPNASAEELDENYRQLMESLSPS